MSIAVRDLNGDGKKDLVAVNQGNDSISVLLGRGDGTFNAAKSYPVADGPFQVAFADFNRDGKVDIVVADTNQVSVLLGNGNGTFAWPLITTPAGTPLVSLATADLRGNGDADVLVGAKSGDLLWFPGAGNGTLGTAQHYAARGAALLQVGDFNRDGAPDVILSGPGGTAMSLLYNQGGTHIGLTTNAATITLGQAVTFTASLGASVPNSGTPTGYNLFQRRHKNYCNSHSGKWQGNIHDFKSGQRNTFGIVNLQRKQFVQPPRLKHGDCDREIELLGVPRIAFPVGIFDNASS